MRTDEPGWLRDLTAPDGSGAVVAYGGAGFSSGATALTPVEQALVRGAVRGRPPVVTLVPTAGGDDDDLIAHFRGAVEQAGGEPHVLSLFARTPAPYGNVLDRTDLVYVTGGAVANLAALWELHGLDEALRAVWRRGVPVSGSSAGALIWAAGGVTTSFGAPAGWTGGLALVSGSLCPHFDTQPERAALYRDLVRRGELPPGLGLDERAAAVLCGGELVGALADDPDAQVHRVG